MSNSKKYIPLPGGLTCKELQKQMFCLEEIEVAIGEPIPLTEVMPEGETFEGEEKVQIEYKGKWVTTHIVPADNVQFKDSAHTRLAIKPLKAIESVKEASDCPKCKWPYDSADHRQSCLDNALSAPLVDAVENKEERVESLYGASLNYAANNKEPTNHVFQLAEAFRQGANWQQSQSIEGLVGFVLEKAKGRIMSYLDSASTDEEKGFQSGIGCALSVFKGLDDDIIKEYNNGK